LEFGTPGFGASDASKMAVRHEHSNIVNRLNPLLPAAWLLSRLRLGAKLFFMCCGVVAALAAVWVGSRWAGDTGAAIAAVLGTVAAAYWFAAFYFSFASGLRSLVQIMEKTADGDLRTRTDVNGRDELATMAAALDRMVRSLSTMVAEVRSNSALVAHAGSNLASSSRELSERTERQAANLEQTAASVEQLSSTVQQNADIAHQSDGRAADVRKAASDSALAMERAVASVEAIRQGAGRMSEIVGVIDGLAFQTNILALNAAVEAARAGEQGRGFAVVATEVRSLAQRSAASAREIRQLIGTSTAQVEASANVIRSAGEESALMVKGIGTVATSLSEISSSSAQQSGGLAEISVAVHQLDQLTQQNAHMVEQTLAEAVSLERRAAHMAEAVSAFKLQQGTAGEAIELVERAHAFVRQRGVSAFLNEASDASQGFYDRDMYVFVLDRHGTYRMFGGNPAKIGTRVQDIPGMDGEAMRAAVFRQAEIAPGWTEYDITNPVSGNVQAKMSFVMALDGDLALGCGVYKRLVA
jgi:methyl-accepting chemotaxis protein